MEISGDILSISGILVNARAKYGDLSKITYVKGSGGSEEIVSHILESLKSFLYSKEYLDEENVPKTNFKTYYEELSLFLIVNTEFSKPFSIEEYAHLTYNVPKISKYLLTTIILNLKITEYYCLAVIKLPIIYSSELFHEFIPCLDKLKQQQLIDDTYHLLYAIAQILVLYEDFKYSDEMDSLVRVIPEFFKRFACISTDNLQKMKKNTMFKYAGIVVNGLFRLLVFCHKNKITGVFIEHSIIATLTVLQAVSLDMFIYWAEIDLESGNSLQSEIAEAAYNIIEMYQQYKPASELVKMLKQFASKPKDIREQIRMADIERIVFMVNKIDNNQKQWFEALICTNFFSNEYAVRCVNKWYHLCKTEDVNRILNLSISSNDEAKKLAIKCASVLEIQDLIVVVIRHFYNNGFVVLNENTQAELVLLFNKLKDSKPIQDEILKDLLLLILQNPENSIDFILSECLKNAFYVNVLMECFSKLQDILKVHDVAVKSLLKIMELSPATLENLENYSKILQVFLQIGLLTTQSLISKILNPLILHHMDKFEELEVLLKISNALEISVQVGENIELFENLMKILALRTRFIDHNINSKNVVRQVVWFINNKICKNTNGVLVENSSDDKFLSFYKKIIQNPSENYTLLTHFFEEYNMENHTRNVCQLMQILPACVTEEWILICSEIAQRNNAKDLLNTINDMMILLCEFTQNQEKSDVYPTLLEALKYCIHHVGIVIQNVVLNNSSLEDEVNVTEILVDMLCYIPENIKETEGLNLINLMTVRSLKSVGEDKSFVTKLCRIKHSKICQIIANKILN